MARKPTSTIPGDDLEVGDSVILRGEVTRMAKNEAGAWEVTVQVEGFSQSRLTLAADYVEKVEE